MRAEIKSEMTQSAMTLIVLHAQWILMRKSAKICDCCYQLWRCQTTGLSCAS